MKKVIVAIRHRCSLKMETAGTIGSVTMLQLTAQLLLFVIVVCNFHYVCFQVMFSLKITNIVSLILASDTPQWKEDLEFYF